jgi:hypothetical protein
MASYEQVSGIKVGKPNSRIGTHITEESPYIYVIEADWLIGSEIKLMEERTSAKWWFSHPGKQIKSGERPTPLKKTDGEDKPGKIYLSQDEAVAGIKRYITQCVGD